MLLYRRYNKSIDTLRRAQTLRKVSNMLDNDAMQLAKLLQTCSVSYIKKGAVMIITELLQILNNIMSIIASIVTVLMYLKQH